jgi:hypothetical protein
MMGWFRYTFSINKWNADPDQQALARLFIDYAERRKSPQDVFAFLEKQIGKWPRKELEDRITHALSMVRVYRVDLYPIAKELGQLIIFGANQPKGEPAVENISGERLEEIGPAVVALIEAKGVRSVHGMLQVLLTTIMVLFRNLPDSEDKERLRKAMRTALKNCP